MLAALIYHDGFHALVAERDGAIIGSNFIDERSPVFGIGPVTVARGVQDQGVGRRLMQAAIDRATARKAVGVRLCQASYSSRSMALYTRLGFQAREMLSVLNGIPLARRIVGRDVRQADLSDLQACNAICQDVHGFDRSAEVREAIERGSATVVMHKGAITGYATEIGFFAHSVARSNEDLKALIAAAPAISGPGFIVPTRNFELFEWCLANGLRLMRPMTLMTMGLYNEPIGAYLTCFLY
jgi:predicted GNAT family N-acyltransferase